jgi:hypothetical protein
VISDVCFCLSLRGADPPLGDMNQEETVSLNVIDVTTFFKETICDNLRLDCTPYETEETTCSKEDTVPLDVIHVSASQLSQ